MTRATCETGFNRSVKRCSPTYMSERRVGGYCGVLRLPRHFTGKRGESTTPRSSKTTRAVATHAWYEKVSLRSGYLLFYFFPSLCKHLSRRSCSNGFDNEIGLSRISDRARAASARKYTHATGSHMKSGSSLAPSRTWRKINTTYSYLPGLDVHSLHAFGLTYCARAAGLRRRSLPVPFIYIFGYPRPQRIDSEDLPAYSRWDNFVALATVTVTAEAIHSTGIRHGDSELEWGGSCVVRPARPTDSDLRLVLCLVSHYCHSAIGGATKLDPKEHQQVQVVATDGPKSTEQRHSLAIY
jgi:hypothetical protein